LVGTGGIGKTRLGLEAARATLEEFPDGVWLAELAPLTDPDLVASAINTALGLQSGAGRWTSERLAAALRGRRLLLVMDNCEHLIGAAAREAETLLRAVPGVCILATSQEPLGLDGECTYRLSPLEFPAEETAELAAALRHDAVRLFAARARAADPHFDLSERNAATVATICRRLDGIPLHRARRRARRGARDRGARAQVGSAISRAHRRPPHGTATPSDVAGNARLESQTTGRTRPHRSAPACRVRGQLQPGGRGECLGGPGARRMGG